MKWKSKNKEGRTSKVRGTYLTTIPITEEEIRYLYEF